MKYYITYYKRKETHPNPTFMDFLAGITNETTYEKTTVLVDATQEELLNRVSKIRVPEPLPLTPDKIKYTTFLVPKRKGGYRTINAPEPTLMRSLEAYKIYFETLSILPHESAHAYVKNRSTITALRPHQQNESKWFLKIDFSDFFGSFNKERILEQFSKVYPLNGLLISDSRQKIEQIIEHCLKDGVLPQGAPTSPSITNICMVPIDYAIDNYCKKANLVYTRYADDMIISGKEPFDFISLVRAINTKLTPEWLNINPAKTRYGSNGGRNWNLGLMLNKNNEITIGHKKKEILKATIFNALINDLSAQEKMETAGYIAYARQIEQDYVNAIIKKLEQKTGQNLKERLK